jgi:DNA polymerase
MFGVNFRHMIRPKDGNKLIVADLSQIEVRTLCWLAEDKKALELIRDSDDIYHAFGVLLGLHNPDNGALKDYDKQLRHKVKSIALGCGYGMGAAKFSVFSGMPLEEALGAVNNYRNRMIAVPKLWRSLDQSMATACAIGEPFQLELPSGRALRYGKIKRMKDTSSADPSRYVGKNRFRYIGKIVRNGQLRDFPLWGGILTENLSQGLARDIFSDMMLRVDAAGFPVILHVHDEMVCEVPEAQAEESLAKILEIMHTPPDWIPDIPVAAEGHILDYYTK